MVMWIVILIMTLGGALVVEGGDGYVFKLAVSLPLALIARVVKPVSVLSPAVLMFLRFRLVLIIFLVFSHIALVNSLPLRHVLIPRARARLR